MLLARGQLLRTVTSTTTQAVQRIPQAITRKRLVAGDDRLSVHRSRILFTITIGYVSCIVETEAGLDLYAGTIA